MPEKITEMKIAPNRPSQQQITNEVEESDQIDADSVEKPPRSSNL